MNTTIIVHNGVFHADDVMCVALMKQVDPNLEVKRLGNNQLTDEMKHDPSIIIADVGFGKFDHHQPDAKLREDGKKYAACGLVFDMVKDILFPNIESAEAFRQQFIIPIEDVDNGVEGAANPLSSAIRGFRPDCLHSSVEAMENGFKEAVEFMSSIVERELLHVRAKESAKEMINEFEHEFSDGILIRDEYFPTSLLCNSTIILEISASLRGGYQLSTIKEKEGSFTDKLQLPEEWLTNKPDGCTFVHQARFIASFETKEQAIAAAKSII